MPYGLPSFSKALKISAAILIAAVVAYNLYIGATVQEIGLPGGLTIKFGPPKDHKEGKDILKVARKWPLIAKDSFSVKSNHWEVGDFNYKGVTGNRRIIDGSYRWKMNFSVATNAQLCVDLNAVNDFYLAIEARLSCVNPTQIGYGLVFRIADIDFNRYYYFQIQDDRIYEFAFWDGVQSKWINIIDWSSTNAIKPGQFNRLEVVANGSVFYFYINGQDLGRAEDNNLKLGKVGLNVGLGVPGEVVVDFKNFELRRKP